MSRLTVSYRLFFVTLMTFLVLSPDLGSESVFGQKRRNRNSLEEMPKPSEDPEVLAKQTAYDESKSATLHAKQMVAESRKALGEALRGARVTNTTVERPPELIEKEELLVRLREDLKLLTKKLVQEMDPETCQKYVNTMDKLKAEMKKELVKSKGKSNARIISITQDLDRVRNQLIDFEKFVVETDESYIALNKKVTDLNQQVVAMRRELTSSKSVFDAKGVKLSKEARIAEAKKTLDVAQDDYKKALLAERAAKKALEDVYKLSVMKYRKYLAQKAEIEKQEKYRRVSRNRFF